MTTFEEKEALEEEIEYIEDKIFELVNGEFTLQEEQIAEYFLEQLEETKDCIEMRIEEILESE